jgi:hypothetical protein
MQPSRPNSAQPGRALAPPARWTPPVSGSPLSRAPSLSRSLPSGADLSAPVSSPARPSSLSTSRARFASCRVVPRASPFLSLRYGPALSDPPHPRRGPASAHSRTSLGFSVTTPTHAPSSFLRASPVPHARPTPHFAQLHTLSRSAHATSHNRRPAPAFPIVQATGDRARPPRAPPRGEIPVPVPNFPYYALCSANFNLAGAWPRRTAVLAWWPADLA